MDRLSQPSTSKCPSRISLRYSVRGLGINFSGPLSLLLSSWVHACSPSLSPPSSHVPGPTHTLMVIHIYIHNFICTLTFLHHMILCTPSVAGVKTEGMFIAKDAQGLAFWVWFYCILWWFVQDICKVVSWKLMKKYNWFGVNKTGAVEFNEQTLRFANQMKQDLGLNRKSMEGRRPSITSHASNSQLHAIAQPLVDV